MTELLRELSISTGLSEMTLRRIISNAPERYKEYRIPKKNGGFRDIAQPARELKLIQRSLTEILLTNLPIHSAATAYIDGKSIRDNAVPHAGHNPITKMDFRDFFPSIKSTDWERYCRDSGCIDNTADIRITSQILFRRPKGGRVLRLAIGAPSSPILSNILMYNFDRLITEYVSKDNVTYTRYADDLTFSGPRSGHLRNVGKLVSKALREIPYPKIRINHGKTSHVTTKYHRHVTGLTLANDGRVTIGRDRKRIIRAQLHRYLTGTFEKDELPQLAGMLAFIKSAEPEFFKSLIDRHGMPAIQAILKAANRDWDQQG